MNLATARYAHRSKEVGVRKSLGASRWSLIKQFIGESLVFSLIAVALSLLLAWSALPLLEQFTGETIRLDSIDLSWILIGLPFTWLVTGIISGSYPAFFLSSFESSEILKGSFRKQFSDTTLRKALVILQFTISMTLIIGAGVIYKQLNYAENKPLGYERDQVLIISNSSTLFDTIEPSTLQQKLKSHSLIREVAYASHFPTRILSNNTMVRPEGSHDNERYSITLNNISPEFQPVLQLDVVKGRNFSAATITDSTALIINEAAADYFGWKRPIGKKIRRITNNELLGEVIGVFKNFHVQSLYESIEPVIFTLGPVDRYNYTLLKLEDHNVPATLQFLEEQWINIDPGHPLEYSFLDSRYESQYRAEQRLAGLVSSFSILAILIACLGLFGLATYTAQQRTKEIGVRKVLGASVYSIFKELSKDFMKLMLIAFFVAIPAAWYFANQWLQNFAYHIEIGIGIFLFSGLLVMGIALTTVGWQSLKAALMNPVESLRSE